MNGLWCSRRPDSSWADAKSFWSPNLFALLVGLLCMLLSISLCQPPKTKERKWLIEYAVTYYLLPLQTTNNLPNNKCPSKREKRLRTKLRFTLSCHSVIKRKSATYAQISINAETRGKKTQSRANPSVHAEKSKSKQNILLPKIIFLKFIVCILVVVSGVATKFVARWRSGHLISWGNIDG